MSRYYWDKKTTVESCLKLKANAYRQAFSQRFSMGTTQWVGTEHNIGFQTRNENGEISLRLSYSQKNAVSGELTNFDYTIRVSATDCYFGGVRYWFFCPSCDRRASNLYQKGTHFACRTCHNLTYSARQDNRRGDFYPILKEIQTLQEFEKLRDGLRVTHYSGKPTRQCRKLVKLYGKIESYGAQMQTSMEKLGMAV